MSLRSLEPFRIEVSDDVLSDLKLRLASVRWPNEPKAARWRYGADLAWMKQVVEHWRTSYDWRQAEARINRWPQYRVPIEGKRIHFILEHGSGPAPMPLILTHGWPGSIVEFLDVIEPLAHPERFGGSEKDSFTVIVPSLPGYGFSDAPDAPIGTVEIARRWSKLMTDVLGFEQYAAQGGDWGGVVTADLARHFPQKLCAVHLNIIGLSPTVDASTSPLSEEEKAWMDKAAKRRATESAYQAIHATKPQTLAYGLTDSPVGLAGWILEKFHGWTVPGSDAPPPFDLDLLLTNVMLYWLNGINAANWLYAAAMADPASRVLAPGEKIRVPTGATLFPNDIAVPPPKTWLRRIFANLEHVRYASAGGHFAAFENPQSFVDDVRSFFDRIRG